MVFLFLVLDLEAMIAAAPCTDEFRSLAQITLDCATYFMLITNTQPNIQNLIRFTGNSCNQTLYRYVHERNDAKTIIHYINFSKKLI